jgi:PadR family transcriptional regulator, regulatory protein PadR
MQEELTRKLFLGFIQLHILHHAAIKPIFGLWMIDELSHHGYTISPGTLYPILHNLEKQGLLNRENKQVEGKIRKYYSITPLGKDVLTEGKRKAYELIKEINEEVYDVSH